MKRLIIIIFVIAVSVTLGLYLKDNPGYVLIYSNPWVIQLSVWMAIIIIALSFIFLHKSINLLRSIINLPSLVSNWRHNRRLKKELNKTSLGLLKLAEGSYKQAFNLLSSSAKYNSKPLINYLTAAKAAQEMDDINKRDEHLKLAYECSPKSGLSIGLMQANLQIANHEYESALATLNNLEQQYGTKKNILRQQLQCNLKLKAWQEITNIIPDLISYKVFPFDNIYNYELQSAVNYFDKLKSELRCEHRNLTSAKINEIEVKSEEFFNNKLSKRVRYKPQVVLAYANCLLSIYKDINKIVFDLNDQRYVDLVNKLIHVLDKSIPFNANLAKNSSENMVNKLYELYGDLSYSDVHLAKLAKFLKYNEHNTDLLFFLGMLAVKIENYEKAFQYFNQVKKLCSDYDIKLNFYLSHVLLKLGKQQESLEMIDSL